jgi:hypothetical protein
MIHQIFLHHPHATGQSYTRHLRGALGYSLTLLGASLACMVHAFLPALFTRTASTKIAELHRRMSRPHSEG